MKKEKLTKKTVGYVTVDTGQIIIVDPGYVVTNKLYQKISTINLTQETERTFLASGIAGYGVTSPTLDGDGSYPVEAEIDKDNRIHSLKITF